MTEGPDFIIAAADRIDAYVETLQRVRDLLNEWEHGEYSATEVEPGIAYCARELRRVLMGGD